MLQEFLTNHREILIDRCNALAADRPQLQPSGHELAHGIPVFFDQIIETLTLVLRDGQSPSPAVQGNAVADSHSDVGRMAMLNGRDLYNYGFSLDQVVRNYGDVCQAVTTLAFETQTPISVDEFRTFNQCLDNAVACAVVEFSTQKMLFATEASFQTQSTRLGALAHELRNCLQSATYAFKVIKSGTVSPSGATAAVVDRSLIAMGNLVERAIAEVRTSAGLPPRQEMLRLAKFLAGVERTASLDADARGLSFTVLPVVEDIVVFADPEMLAAALGNLLQNAFKFTKHGSHVRLSTHVVADRVLIDVEDQCGGLPAGRAETLFLPFQQRGEDRSGLGLGLDICRRNIEANAGLLTVRDVPQVGCVFTIDLPRHLPS